MRDKPVIGVLLDWQEEGTFSSRPHYALRQLYFDAIAVCGGLPIGLPYDDAQMKDYINKIDGLFCPGGNYASPKSWYLEGEQTTYDDSPRADYEIKLIRAALKAGKPFLGICGGMQVMAAAFDAKMTGDLHQFYDTDINHKNGCPADEFAFDIDITPGTLLSRITGNDQMKVNSAHREAVVIVPDQVKVSAISSDQIIQAIELPAYPFALGVQWHPEFFVKDDQGEPGHRRIIEAFIEASRG
ncbi:MAG: gamma-glutamyl-gamma-aminobutyrate hydrolase family protein [Pseudomonadota bacterium]